jgi:hypothetical protein
MQVRTNLCAGEFVDDVVNSLNRAGNYLAQVIKEADAQASQLTSDVIFVSSSLADCLNTSLRNRTRS